MSGAMLTNLVRTSAVLRTAIAVMPVFGLWCFFSAICIGIVRGQANSSIPFTTECLFTRHGREYVGTRNVTDNGLTCQAWTSNSPHSHPFTSASSNEFPGDGGPRQAGNKCRNPDLSWYQGLWCYTLHPSFRWRSCRIPMCECKLNWDVAGVNYLGVLSTTRTGKLCQRWNASTPHRHPFNSGSFFNDDSVARAENYCRNPNASRPDGPWCYTVDSSVEWEYCSVPVCNLTTPASATSATTATMSTTTMVTSTRAGRTTRSTRPTSKTTRSTRRTESTSTSTTGPSQSKLIDNAKTTSVLVPSVVSVGVIALVVAVCVVVFLRYYRDGKPPTCDVIRRILPGKQTSSVPERLESSRDAINPPSIIPPKEGFSNPLFDTITTAPSADQQPIAAGPVTNTVTVAVDEGRVTMSQIHLT